jgi:hypothetical protein
MEITAAEGLRVAGREIKIDEYMGRHFPEIAAGGNAVVITPINSVII